MKIKARFPAFVTAKVKGGRVARPAVILPEGEFTVHDVTAEQAPMAFSVEVMNGDRQESVSEIRSYRGRLFRVIESEGFVYERVKRPATMEDLLSLITENPLGRGEGSVLLPTLEMVRRQMMSVADGTVIPSGIHMGIGYKKVIDDSDLARACRSLADNLVADDAVEAAISGWQADAQTEIDKYLVVDGRVHMLCGEPVYTVSGSLDVHYTQDRSGHGLVHDNPTFSAADSEAAHREWLARREEGGYRSDRQATITVFDPDFVTWRAEEMDFDRFARYFEGCTKSRIRTIMDRHGNIRIPREVYDSWLDLRELLDSYDPETEQVPEDLEGVLSNAISTYRRFHQTLEGDLHEHGKPPEEETCRMMFSRFADRPIAFPRVATAVTP